MDISCELIAITNVIGSTVSWQTKFVSTVWLINLTVPISLKGHCRTAFIRKFSIIWGKSLPGSNIAHTHPVGLSFTATLRACVPAVFAGRASGGRSHCVWYLSGSFDILRQFAFVTQVDEIVSSYESSGVYTHIGRVRTPHQSQHVLWWQRVTQPTWCKIWSRPAHLSHKSRTSSLRNVYPQIL